MKYYKIPEDYFPLRNLPISEELFYISADDYGFRWFCSCRTYFPCMKYDLYKDILIELSDEEAETFLFLDDL